MPAWHSFSYAFGPLVALAAIGLLVLILKWSSARGGSVVPGPAQVGDPKEYGLLTAVRAPAGFTEGEALRLRLAAAGIRATLVHTTDGLRLMVWPEDVVRAHELL